MNIQYMLVSSTKCKYVGTKPKMHKKKPYNDSNDQGRGPLESNSRKKAKTIFPESRNLISICNYFYCKM